MPEAITQTIYVTLVVFGISFFVYHLINSISVKKDSLEYNALISQPRKKSILDRKDMILLCLSKEEQKDAILKMKRILKAQFDAPSNKNKPYFIVTNSIEKQFKDNISFLYAQIVCGAFQESGMINKNDLSSNFAIVPTKATLKQLSESNYI
jgi:hypothetical protein